MKDLVRLLSERKLTIAAVPHASKVFYGSLVTYQSACKIDVLKIDKQLIDKYGVISSQCAKAMAEKGHVLFKTDIVVSCTGNAGPDVMDNKAVGLVYMGIYYQGEVIVLEKIFSGDRNEIRSSVVDYLCDSVKNLLE